MGSTRSHVKHLLQHILVNSLEAVLPSFEVEAALARSDRGRTVIVLELCGEMEARTTAHELLQDQHVSRPFTANPRTSASTDQKVSTDQDDLPRLLTIHGGRDGNGPGRSGVGMAQGKGEFL